MLEYIKPIAAWSAVIVEAIGVGIIAIIAFYVVFYGLFRLFRKDETEALFQKIRLRLGRGILLGLEFLLAGDIIHTVAVELTFETVGVLSLIVIIRTFLSFTLEVELTGRWPWQHP